jgi:hypothetical protein
VKLIGTDYCGLRAASIISGIVAAVLPDVTLGRLATVTLEVVPFCPYAPFPTLLPFFKCILEAVFCEGVQHRLRFCRDHINYVKIPVFQFYLRSGKQKNKVGGG